MDIKQAKELRYQAMQAYNDIYQAKMAGREVDPAVLAALVNIVDECQALVILVEGS